MITKTTPGPWDVNEDGWKVESKNEHGWINDGWIVCSTHGPDAEGNARLIAAAPDLLEALRELYVDLVANDQDGLIEHVEPMRKARSAIAKAEGKS